MTRTLTITHEGVTYYGQIATITETRLGPEDHGIFTATVTLRSGSGGNHAIFGGYSLDEPPRDGRGADGRVGTGFGMDHVIRIMWAVGVDRWERLIGRQVIALSTTDRLWPVVGIAHVQEDRVFIPEAHLAAWLAAEATP